MRTNYEKNISDANAIERHIRQYDGVHNRIVNVSNFSKVARVLWPFKTAAHLASIAKKDERTAARWLSGEFEPPGIVIAAIVMEITKRD
jgi:hypothetical protein